LSLLWTNPDDAERFKGQPVERVVGLHGIRWWRVGIDRETIEPILVSTYRVEHAWRGPVLESDKDPVEHALAQMPSHGIYVVKTNSECAQKMHDSCQNEVAGVVEMIGPTVEHEQGYRTSKVVIQTLILPACNFCDEPPEYLCFDLSGQSLRISVYPPPNWLEQDIAKEPTCPMHLVSEGKWTCEHHGPTGEDGVNVPDLVKLWERRYECEVTDVSRLSGLLSTD
jgi:hypothetical protein